MNPFLTGYLECAEWSSSGDETEEHLDALCLDWAQEALDRATKECAEFEANNEAALDRYYDLTGRDAASAGHDLWLTRNGHGAGFWDRCREDAFDDLCAAAEALGECSPYIGDDRLIYLE